MWIFVNDDWKNVTNEQFLAMSKKMNDGSKIIADEPAPVIDSVDVKPIKTKKTKAKKAKVVN